jgi:hypothetical protein
VVLYLPKWIIANVERPLMASLHIVVFRKPSGFSRHIVPWIVRNREIKDYSPDLIGGPDLH